jgi:foldase protein PrsA
MKKLYAAGLIVLLSGLAACNAGKGTVARVGKDRITVKELGERIQDAPPAYQNYLTTDAGKKQFLDLMVRERVVIEASRQAGFQRNSEYRKAMDEFKKDQARRARDFEENLMMELFIRDLHTKQIGSTDAEIDKYYAEHKREYDRPVQVVARHILVPTQAEAEKALARLKSGEDFIKLAGEVSTDPISAARGGEIGPFKKGDLVPEFEKAVFSLKINQTSDVVPTQFGYHIIRKVSEKALPAFSADEAKLEIRKMLEKTKFDAWFDQAKKRHGVSVNYSMLSKVMPPAQPSLPGAMLPGKTPAQPDAPAMATSSDGK